MRVRDRSTGQNNEKGRRESEVVPLDAHRHQDEERIRILRVAQQYR